MLSSKNNQQGAVILLFALLLPIFFGILALAMDYGRMSIIKSQLQIVADSTALEAARRVAYPSTSNPNGNFVVPNWTNANTQAALMVSSNPVNQVPQTDVFFNNGYWNINQTPPGLRATSITPSVADKPAITIIAPYGGTQNTQGINLLFAPVIGIDSASLSASATAGISAPGMMKNNAVYPIAISKCLLDNYWNSTTGKPTKDPHTGQTYVLALEEKKGYGVCSDSMSWTFFFESNNHNAANLKDLMQSLNPNDLWIGSTIYLSTSALMSSVVKYIQYPIDVILPVTANVSTSTQNIIAFCSFRLTSVSRNNKQILGSLTEIYIHPAAYIGNGDGQYYGILTPPLLFN